MLRVRLRQTQSRKISTAQFILITHSTGQVMKPDEIKAGTCYRTSKNEVRQVLEITSENRVLYRARNSAYAKGEAGWYQNHNAGVIPMLATFAHAVVGEVPCDWDSATTAAPLPSRVFLPVAMPTAVEPVGE